MTKHYLSILIAAFTICFTACKKDELSVKEAQSYVQLNYTPSGPLDGGWSLTLQPNGVADILPGGDIIYRGAYKIKGDKVKIKSNGGDFEFKIISETELKEIKYGTILTLRLR